MSVRPPVLALVGALLTLSAGLVLAGCGGGGKSRSVNPPIVTVLPTSYTIASASMEPTLHCAKPAADCEADVPDEVAVEVSPGDLKRGDIVVFNTPPLVKQKCGADGKFIDRIIGLPGDEVEVRVLRGNGYVFINGRKLNEPYIQTIRRSPASTYGLITVLKDNYFMLGDNRAQSCDSRFWGSVPTANIIGKVTKIIRTG